jgi:hypothetical protein
MDGAVEAWRERDAAAREGRGIFWSSFWISISLTFKTVLRYRTMASKAGRSLVVTSKSLLSSIAEYGPSTVMGPTDSARFTNLTLEFSLEASVCWSLRLSRCSAISDRA